MPTLEDFEQNLVGRSGSRPRPAKGKRVEVSDFEANLGRKPKAKPAPDHRLFGGRPGSIGPAKPDARRIDFTKVNEAPARQARRALASAAKQILTEGRIDPLEARGLPGQVAAFVPNIMAGLFSNTVGEGIRTARDFGRSQQQAWTGRRPTTPYQSAAYRLARARSGSEAVQQAARLASSALDVAGMTVGGGLAKEAAKQSLRSQLLRDALLGLGWTEAAGFLVGVSAGENVPVAQRLRQGVEGAANWQTALTGAGLGLGVPLLAHGTSAALRRLGREPDPQVLKAALEQVGNGGQQGAGGQPPPRRVAPPRRPRTVRAVEPEVPEGTLPSVAAEPEVIPEPPAPAPAPLGTQGRTPAGRTVDLVDLPHPDAYYNERGQVMMPTRSLVLRPDEMQYKVEGKRAGGSTGSIPKDVDYDPQMAGEIEVWVDPKTGEAVVVNGHNRHDKALSSGVEAERVRFLQAETPQEAAALGALANIADDRGTAFDAATVFRALGIGPENLKQYNISLQKRVSAEGVALSRLSDPLWKSVRDRINGNPDGLDPSLGAIIGAGNLDAAGQEAVWRLVQKHPNPSRGLVQSLVEQAEGAGSVAKPGAEAGQTSFLGAWGEPEQENLLIHKAQLAEAVRRRLGGEQAAFRTGASDLFRQRIEGAGVGTTDAAKSRTLATEAEQALEAFNATYTLAGTPANRLMDAAARRLANGEAFNEVRDDLLKELRREVSASIARGEGPSAAGVRADAGAPQGTLFGAEQPDNSRFLAALQDPELRGRAQQIVRLAQEAERKRSTSLPGAADPLMAKLEQERAALEADFARLSGERHPIDLRSDESGPYVTAGGARFEAPATAPAPSPAAGDLFGEPEVPASTVAPESTIAPAVVSTPERTPAAPPAAPKQAKPASTAPEGLTPEQRKQWDEAEAEYRETVSFAQHQAAVNGDADELLGKRLKAAGMRWAAAKRRITGNLTAKEKAAAEARAARVRAGAPVSIETPEGTLRGTALDQPRFGKVKVELEDGTTRAFERGQVTVRQETAPPPEVAPEAAPPKTERPAASSKPKARRVTLEAALKVPKEERPRIVRIGDSFKERNAPKEHYVDARGEDRVRWSGDAYTEDYMVRSQNSGQLARYYAEMSDGSIQGLDSAALLSMPEHAEAVGRLVRGRKLQDALDTVFANATPEEQRSMVLSPGVIDVLAEVVRKSGAERIVGYPGDSAWLVLPDSPKTAIGKGGRVRLLVDHIGQDVQDLARRTGQLVPTRWYQFSSDLAEQVAEAAGIPYVREPALVRAAGNQAHWLESKVRHYEQEGREYRPAHELSPEERAEAGLPPLEAPATPEAPAPQAAPKKAPLRIVPDSAVAWADEVIAQRKGRLNTADPELLTAHAIKAARWIEDRGHDFAAWAKEMVEQYGEDLREHLQAIWDRGVRIYADAGRHQDQFFQRLTRSEPTRTPEPGVTGVAKALTGRPAQEGVSREGLLETARAAVESGKLDPTRAARESLRSGKPLSAEELAGVGYRRRVVENRRAEIRGQSAKTQDPTLLKALQDEHAALDAEDATLLQAADLTLNRGFHRLGMAAQVALRKDFSMADLPARARLAALGQDIPGLEARIAELTRKNDELAAALKGAREKLEAELSKPKPSEPSAPRPRRQRERDIALLQRYFGVAKGEPIPQTPRMGPEAGAVVYTLSGPEMAARKAMRRLARDLREQGAGSLDEVIDGIRQVVGGQVPEEQILRMLSEPYRKYLLESDVNRLKSQQYLREVQRAADQRLRGPVRRALSTAGEILSATQRSMQAGMDLSAPFIQGAKSFLPHTRTWLAAWKPMLEAAAKGEDVALSHLATIQRHPRYASAKAAGLELTHTAEGFTKQEEMFAGNLPRLLSEKAPPVIRHYFKALVHSEAAYTAFLNDLRWNLWLRMTAADPRNPAFLKAMAEVVNTMTGRGSSRLAQVIGQTSVSGNLLYAPRYLVSQWETALGRPLVSGARGGWEGLKQAAKFYWANGAALAALTAPSVVGLAKSFGWDIDTDWRSTDFGKVTVRGAKVDLFGRLTAPARLVFQTLYGHIGRSGTYTPPSGYEAGSTLGRYLQGKASPLVRSAWEEMFGHLQEDSRGRLKARPVTWPDRFRHYLPLWVQQELEEPTRKTRPALTAARILGIDVGTGKPIRKQVPLDLTRPGLRTKPQRRRRLRL